MADSETILKNIFTLGTHRHNARIKFKMDLRKTGWILQVVQDRVQLQALMNIITNHQVP
jgi:hypothetical protein